LLAAELGVRTIYSVETDNAYLEGIKSWFREHKTTSKFFPILADIGPTAKWGKPTDRSQVENWPNYASLPWKLASENQHLPDLVLIDGRFRVASFLMSLLCAPAQKTILFDDYF